MDEATFDQTIAVNLKGAFLVAKHAIPHLRATRGSVVFTARGQAGCRQQGLVVCVGFDHPGSGLSVRLAFGRW